MSSIQQYLDKIRTQKQSLVSALQSQGIDSSIEESLETIVMKSSNQMETSKLLPSEKTSFSTSKSKIKIAINGIGSVVILYGQKEIAKIELSDKIKQYELSSNEQGENEFTIALEGEVGVLDLHDNNITKFTLGHQDKINRLLLYSNSLTMLNCSRNQNLQFLHMFNNPICDEEEYKPLLKLAFESLADRSDKAIGSIVFYPWYGLEKLIEKKNGVWKKYPSAHAVLNFEDGRLYGEVVNSEIVYYRYLNDELRPYTEMNRHHTIRKDFEKNVTLSKNWMFGSAILYSEEADKFCYYLRETGVQDVWETAEKGFGICVGTTDYHAGRIDAWEDLNLKGYIDVAGIPMAPWDDKKFWEAEAAGKSAQHGDFCLSQMVGRGGEGVFGFAPNAQCYLADYYTGDDLGKVAAVKTLCDNCQIIASSLVDTWDEERYAQEGYLKGLEVLQKARRHYGIFGQTHPFFISAGNWGDGTQWGYKQQNGYVYYCNYGTEEDFESLEFPSTVIYVASLTPAKTLSNYSGNSNVIDKTPYYTEMLPNDSYIAHYGEVLGWRDDVPKSITGKEKDGAIGWAQGTSMSCPNCGGTFILMRKIYSKLYPEETNYGKHSPFMDYVKTHWMDPLDDLTSFSVGMGLPCFLASPRKEYQGSNKTSGAFSIDGLKVGQPFDIVGVLVDGNKNGCAFDYDHNFMAQISENTFIPIQPFSSGTMTVQGYTKNFLNNPTTEQKAENYNKITFSLEAPLEQSFIISQTDKVPLIEVNSFDYGMSTHDDVYYTLGQSQNRKFTLQFVIDMKSIIKAAPVSEEQVTENNVTTTEYTVGNQKIVLINIPNSQNYLYFCVGGLKANSLTDVVIQYGPGSSKVTSFRVMSASSPRTVPATVGGISNIIHLSENDVGVITLCLDETDLLGYYNGNLMFRLPLEYVRISAKDFAIKASMVKDGKIENAIAYDRILSQEEIISNSIALLQSLS